MSNKPENTEELIVDDETQEQIDDDGQLTEYDETYHGEKLDALLITNDLIKEMDKWQKKEKADVREYMNERKHYVSEYGSVEITEVADSDGVDPGKLWSELVNFDKKTNPNAPILKKDFTKFFNISFTDEGKKALITHKFVKNVHKKVKNTPRMNFKPNKDKCEQQREDINRQAVKINKGKRLSFQDTLKSLFNWRIK